MQIMRRLDADAASGLERDSARDTARPACRLLFRMPLSPRFRHIVFPREQPSARLVDVAALDETCAAARESHRRLPLDEEQFLAWLLAKADLDVASYRPETLSRRLAACLRALRVANLGEARLALERNPLLVPPALSVMLVGVTSFFRDRAVYDTLARDVLPSLADSRRNLYVWSAGCSDGSELYSTAMLLAESDILSGSYLLGTDCRTDAIDVARQGRYTDGVLCHVPAEFHSRYFTSDGNHWQVVPELRRAARWRVANVLSEREPGLWDLILCRNTSIYLRSDATRALWQKLEDALRPGGILVLGRAERPLGAKCLTSVGPCIFRKMRR